MSSTINTTNSIVEQKFKLFPKLPLEIRRKIWVHSLPGPRIIKLIYDEKKEECWSPATIPECLHICKESRVEALRYYSLAFGSKLRKEGPFGDIGRVYFDFSVDSLYLPGRARDLSRFRNWANHGFLLGDLLKSTSDLTLVQHVAFRETTLYALYICMDHPLEIMKGFGGGAKTFHLLFPDAKVGGLKAVSAEAANIGRDLRLGPDAIDVSMGAALKASFVYSSPEYELYCSELSYHLGVEFKISFVAHAH